VASASIVINGDGENDFYNISSSKLKNSALHSKGALKIALARMKILGHLTNSELDSLLDNKKNRKVSTEQFVYCAGDPSEFFFYIKSGVFEIVSETQGVVQKRTEGQIFGDVDLVPQRARSESVRCLSAGGNDKAVLVSFPRSALVYILAKRDGFALSESESDSDSDSETDVTGYSDNKTSEDGSNFVQMDDIFCGVARRGKKL